MDKVKILLTSVTSFFFSFACAYWGTVFYIDLCK